MTTSSLAAPNMEQLKKQAKDLLKAYRQSSPEAAERFRKSHPEYAALPPGQIPATRPLLADAQLVIAREQGYVSWSKLKREVERLAEEAALAGGNSSVTTTHATLREIVAEFGGQMQNPASVDRTLLKRGKALIADILERGEPIDRKTARAGWCVCSWLNDKRTVVKWLERYCEQPLDIEQQAWAQKEIVNRMGDRIADAVTRHEGFIAWGLENLPPDRFPWLISISGEALRWIELKRGEDWMRICDAIERLMATTADNRMERFFLLRTKSMIQNNLGRTRDSLATMSRVKDLANEDSACAYGLGIQVRALQVVAHYHHILNEPVGVRRAVDEGIALLADYERQLNTTENPDRDDISTAYNNLAAAALEQGWYEEAIPLMRRALDSFNGKWNANEHLSLAAAIWATSKNREETLALIRQAAKVALGRPVDLKDLKEFNDVIDDPEFLAAVAQK